MLLFPLGQGGGGSFPFGQHVPALDFDPDALSQNAQKPKVFFEELVLPIIEQAGHGHHFTVTVKCREAAIGIGLMIGQKGCRREFTHDVLDDADILGGSNGRTGRHTDRAHARIREDFALHVNTQKVQLLAPYLRQADDFDVEQLADHAGDMGENLDRVARQQHAQFIKLPHARQVVRRRVDDRSAFPRGGRGCEDFGHPVAIDFS